VLFGISYVWQIWVYRVLVWVVPFLVLFLARRICDDLRLKERIEAEKARAEEQARAAEGMA